MHERVLFSIRPRQDKWYGDVIAYGQWLDLTEEEILRLRNDYELDELVNATLNQ